MHDQELGPGQALHLIEDRLGERIGSGAERLGDVVDVLRDPLFGPPRRHPRTPETGANYPKEKKRQRNHQSIADAQAHGVGPRLNPLAKSVSV